MSVATIPATRKRRLLIGTLFEWVLSHIKSRQPETPSRYPVIEGLPTVEELVHWLRDHGFVLRRQDAYLRYDLDSGCAAGGVFYYFNPNFSFKSVDPIDFDFYTVDPIGYMASRLEVPGTLLLSIEYGFEGYQYRTHLDRDAYEYGKGVYEYSRRH